MQTVDDNWIYPNERHAAFEMIYVVDGIEKIECSPYSYFLNRGDFAIISPGTFHQVSANSKLTYFCFHFDLDEPVFEEHLISNSKLVYRSNEKATRVITSCMDKMIEVVSSTTTVEKYNFADKMKLQMLLSRILLVLYEDADKSETTENVSNMQYAKLIRVHIKKQLHDQVTQAIDHPEAINNSDIIADICRQLNLSISYASRIFKTCYGTSPKSYLSSIKQEIAQELLLKPQFDVNQISLLLGYSNPGNFSRQFKIWTGITPRQFRMRKVTHFVDERLFSENFSTYSKEDGKNKNYRDQYWDSI